MYDSNETTMLCLIHGNELLQVAYFYKRSYSLRLYKCTNECVYCVYEKEGKEFTYRLPELVAMKLSNNNFNAIETIDLYVLRRFGEIHLLWSNNNGR